MKSRGKHPKTSASIEKNFKNKLDQGNSKAAESKRKKDDKFLQKYQSGKKTSKNTKEKGAEEIVRKKQKSSKFKSEIKNDKISKLQTKEKQVLNEGVLKKLKKMRKGQRYELKERFEDIKRIYLEKYEMKNLKSDYRRDGGTKSKAKSCNTFQQLDQRRRRLNVEALKGVQESGIYESPFEQLSEKTRKMIKKYREQVVEKIKSNLTSSKDKKSIFKSMVKPEKNKSASRNEISDHSKSVSRGSRKNKRKKDEQSKKIKFLEQAKSKRGKLNYDQDIKFSKRFGTLRNKSMGKPKESKKNPVRRKQISEKVGIQLFQNSKGEDKGRSRKTVKMGLRPSIRKKRNSRKTPLSVGKVRFIESTIRKETKGRFHY